MYKLTFNGGVFMMGEREELVAYSRRVLSQRYKHVFYDEEKGVIYGDSFRAAQIVKVKND